MFSDTNCGIYCSKKRLKCEYDDPDQFVKSQVSIMVLQILDNFDSGLTIQ